MAPPEGADLPESSLPWLWVIEYLASSERANAKLLYGIIESAPLSRDELGKNVRELVALACLEQLCGPEKEKETMCCDPSNSDSGSGSIFELSWSCEDVLEDILEEGSFSDLRMTGKEQLKAQVCRFVMHKRNSMPKPALEQLRDTILEGMHPDAASLKLMSGLACSSDSHRVLGGNVEHGDGRRDNDSCMGPNNTGNLDGRINDVGDQREVLPSDANEPVHCPGCSLQIDGEDSPEDDFEDADGTDDDESNISNHTISLRRRTIWRVGTSPVVSCRRQKKAPWTEEEVKILKECVEKFRNADDKTITWKQILEFGAGVFMHDRTARDLKNKWTNISGRYRKFK
ncbi:hypothetical protein CRG98_007714 [Punica granatum]|nr:hypothetical protein CRG98_007714 [Punica granatum]